MCSDINATITTKKDRPFTEACGRAEYSAAPAARAEHAREIELDRVERDRIRQVLLVHERWNQRLVRRAAERLRHPGQERQRQDVPDADVAEEDERGQRERRGHLDVLRTEEQAPAIVAIGNDAANEGEEQDRQLSQEIVESRRRVLGEIENEPALRDFLHPCADGRGKGPNHRMRKSR